MKYSKDKIKYVMYVRKSSESEDRQVQSIEDQLSKLDELKITLGLDIVKIFKEAKSAKKPHNRPQFTEMLEYIRLGKADGVVCWQLNRLSRNPIDSGEISWMLQNENIKCIQTIDKKYLPGDNVIVFNVETGMANQFIIDLKKNTRRGVIGKLERGGFPSAAPLGYLNEKLEKTIIIDSERFTLIRKMWDLMLTGNYNPSQIVRIANDDWGFRTPVMKRRGGTKLSLSTIYKMFSNPFYVGMMSWGDMLYQGKHKAMITTEEFERVQKILGKNTKRRTKKDMLFAFTGMMRCGECNCQITAEERKKIIKKTGEEKSYQYYRCTHKRKDYECLQKGAVTNHDLEQQIISELGKYKIKDEFKKWAFEIMERDHEIDSKTREQIHNSLQQVVSEGEKKLDQVLSMHMKGLLDDNEYLGEKKKIKSEINVAQDELNNLHVRSDKNRDLVKNTITFATHAVDKFNTGDLQTKREILSALGSNLILKDKRLYLETHPWIEPLFQFNHDSKTEVSGSDQKKLQKVLKNKSESSSMSINSPLFLRWGDYRESNPDRRFHKPPC